MRAVADGLVTACGNGDGATSAPHKLPGTARPRPRPASTRCHASELRASVGRGACADNASEALGGLLPRPASMAALDLITS
ncbi:hypothetical protein SNL152K_868 [Streptomyces sp. NL15-2K]|nr:hypothetical protein SNL152K_868 [Streptomyces sp. NL15-2K]